MILRDILWAIATVCFLVVFFFAGLVALWLLPFLLVFMMLTRRY